MTVSYQYEVASSTSGGFTRLLFKWKGSLYKLIYRELALFLICFQILSFLYRNLLDEQQKRTFEKSVIYCDTFINLIPLSFVLGFYVTYVATRWWQQYMAIPWPDKLMHNLALYIPGDDDQARILKRSLMRYLNLTLVLILRSISSAVKKRFPTCDHLIEVGFMTAAEYEHLQAVKHVEFNTYWIPCTWFIHQLRTLKQENPNFDAHGLKIIMEEFNEFRSKCGLLWSYDWVSIPLVYTQVVTLATYSFFIAALVGRQYVESSTKPLQMQIDIYLPVFTILQFFFFMGLLKVAEQLINPFGNDDEDFELNWLIDRHTKVSYLGVDTMMLRCPPLVKDKYFDDSDAVLPYTGASFAYKRKTHRGSMHNMHVPENQQSMYLPEIVEEEFDDDGRGEQHYKPSADAHGTTPAGNSPVTNDRTFKRIIMPTTPRTSVYWSSSSNAIIRPANVTPMKPTMNSSECYISNNDEFSNGCEIIQSNDSNSSYCKTTTMNHSTSGGHIGRDHRTNMTVASGWNPKRRFSFSFNRFPGKFDANTKNKCENSSAVTVTKHSSFRSDSGYQKPRQTYLKRSSDGDIPQQFSSGHRTTTYNRNSNEIIWKPYRSNYFRRSRSILSSGIHTEKNYYPNANIDNDDKQQLDDYAYTYTNEAFTPDTTTTTDASTHQAPPYYQDQHKQ